MAAAMQKSVLPYEKFINVMRYPVHENMVTLPGNRLLSVIRLKGVPHETCSDETLNKQFANFNKYLQALGKKEGKNILIQSYIKKSSIEVSTRYSLAQPYLQNFVNAYTKPFRSGSYYQVQYTLVLVLKYRNLDDGINRMDELLTISRAMLSDYDAIVMGIEENRHGALFSQIGRFYGHLINGYEQDVLLSDTRLGDAIIDSVTNYGALDYVINRPNAGGERFATTYDLRDYPSGGSKPGMWDEAIDFQCDFTLVQSFLFKDRQTAKSDFKKQTADLGSVEGESKQTDELKDAVQEITQGEKVFGVYHAALIVFGGSPDEAIDNGAKLTSLFTVRDTTFVRSTMSNWQTWFCQFPAYLDVLYPHDKSTENFACGFSLHATPSGKARGNPIGDGTALMPMRTVNESLFMLNAHDSPPGQNNLGEALPGHLAVTGMTGAGKTTVEAAILTFFSRWDPMWFIIDYNESLRNLAEALGTNYNTLEPGVFTGINPFQFPDTPSLRSFLNELVVTAAGGKDITNDEEQLKIKGCIEAVMKHTVVSRRSMSLLVQGLTPMGGNCLHTRLTKWCHSVGGRSGQNAWVIDTPVNSVHPEDFHRLAFDCTNILKKSYSSKNPQILEVLLNTLFYMKTMMHAAKPGSILLNVIAEYWVPLSYESTAESIKEVLKSGRMRGETLIMDTQSPEDAIETPYAAAVVQQVVTSIWLANTKADRKGYEKFGVKGKVFDQLVEMTPLSRELIVLQGHQAVKLKFELDEALKYWLPLLSSTKKNIDIAKRIREEVGSVNPDVWVPAFLDEMKRLDKQAKAKSIEMEKAL